MGTVIPSLTRSAELEGKRAIITGASRGLGVAIAHAFWAAGADVLLVARSEENLRGVASRLLASRGGMQSVHLLAADLTEPGAPQAIVSEARRIWPRIDILVNNAGIIGPIGTIADNDWGEWRDAIQINLLAPAGLCRLAIEWMRTSGGGSIINLSGGGATSPRPRFSAYATAKCGLVRFSETIAAEVSDFGIRVNCVAPGAMNTEMLQATLSAGVDRVGRDEFDKIAKTVAAGATDPGIAAELVVYLASESSAGITGKLISAVWDTWRNLRQHVDDLRTTDIYTLRRIVPNDRGREWSNG
jgi:3-oxoacyl-[acyl-carrier protein] reductase